jgi:putative ABC transporter type IV
VESRVDPIELAANTALFGIGGWALENAIYGPRFSAVFGRAKVPFLPVYAIGGAMILLTKPRMKRIPWILRVPIYTALLTGIEFVGCQIDRRVFGACSWDYTNAGCANALEGCLDVSHSLLWGALGVFVEALAWVADHAGQRSRARSMSGTVGAWPRNAARPANRAALAAWQRRRLSSSCTPRTRHSTSARRRSAATAI